MGIVETGRGLCKLGDASAVGIGAGLVGTACLVQAAEASPKAVRSSKE